MHMSRRNENVDSINVIPRGPVFLSYRHSDGTELAVDMAWALRAAGIPVWLDRDDLPPGDTERHLDEAMQSGLSGAVLLITPDIGASSCIKDVELPRLLALEATGLFTLSIGTTIKTKYGGLDYCAPDRLLAQCPPKLKGMHQDPALTPRDFANIARNHCRRRMEALRKEVKAAGQVIDINIQTRIRPSASVVKGDLVVRLRPPMTDDRRPNRQGLEDLQLFLSDLPHLLEIADARHVRVSGGAHLSVAFALGAALPTTLLRDVEVVDTRGHTWTLTSSTSMSGSIGEAQLLQIIDLSPHEATYGSALIYIDLVHPPSNSALNQFLAGRPGQFAKVLHVRTAVEGDLRSVDASAIVAELAYAIRQAASLSEASEVHLFLRCPFAVALLLGRTLNTIRVHLYEWEQGPDDDGRVAAPRYLPSLVVRSGAGGGPIERVVLPARPEAPA